MTAEAPWFNGCRSTMHGGSWHWYRGPKGSNCKTEMFALVSRGTTVEQAARIAELKDLLKRAERGDCLWDHDVVEVSRARDLLELRWQFVQPMEGEAPPVHLRLYFIEPRTHVGVMVALHIARKDVHGTDVEIKAWQNAAIDEADGRRRTGATTGWGI